MFVTVASAPTYSQGTSALSVRNTGRTRAACGFGGVLLSTSTFLRLIVLAVDGYLGYRKITAHKHDQYPQFEAMA